MLRSLPSSDFERSALLMLDQSKPWYICIHVDSNALKDTLVVRYCWRSNVFELSCVLGVDFWSEVGPHTEQVDLMVEPSQVSKVKPCHNVNIFCFWHNIILYILSLYKSSLYRLLELLHTWGTVASTSRFLQLICWLSSYNQIRILFCISWPPIHLLASKL